MHPVHEMMVVPTRIKLESVAAVRTIAALRRIQFVPLFQITSGSLHPLLSQLFTVRLPDRIEGVELPFHLPMSPDLRTTGVIELQHRGATVMSYCRCGKHPASTTDRVKILPFNPFGILVWMPPLGPPPESLKNQMLHANERLLGDRGLVILCPTPQHR